MSEPLPLGLAQQEKARSINPEQLEKFGKQAADMYAGAGTPLTDAVVETVKVAMLSPEQVKRVCEFANTTAYLAAFEKAGNVRNVTFEGGPANPARVLQDLNDGSSPTLLTESSDYKKTASADFRHYAALDVLAQMFHYPAGKVAAEVLLDKTASAQLRPHQHANPLDDLLDTKQALEAMRDELASMKTGAKLVLDDVVLEMSKAAEQQMMNGYSLSEVLHAFAAAAESPAQAKYAMINVRDYLREHGHSNAEFTRSMTKGAHAGRIVNPAHPLVVKFSAFVKAAHALRVVESALSDVQEQIKQTNKTISGVIV